MYHEQIALGLTSFDIVRMANTLWDGRGGTQTDQTQYETGRLQLVDALLHSPVSDVLDLLMAGQVSELN